MMLYMLAHVMKHYGWLEKKAVATGVLLVTTVYAAMFPVRMKDVPYHGAQYKEGRLIMEQYADTPWIIYGEKDWVLHCPAFDFLIPEKIMFHTDTSTMVYDEIMANNKELVLYVRSEEHLSEVIEKMNEISGGDYQYELLAERPYNDAYLITLK